jgi:S-formylglutathione hydrolase FrmB
MIKTNYKLKLQFLLLSLFLVSAVSIFGQTVKTKTDDSAGKVSKQILDSKLMAREMPYNLLLPKNYNDEANKAARFSVIYLLHGLTGHYNNWAENTKLEQYAANYNYIIVMPEGNNGWYTDSVGVPNDKYESYIVKELIPEIDKKYRTKAERKNRAIAGLSMGGYGSLKFGLKYPEMFALAGSFSGALGITEITDKNADAWVSKSVMSVYGDAESETRKANDIFKFVREITPEKVKNLPFIYVDCGTEDFLIKNNRDFIWLLAEKKILHEYRELPGAHDWKFWDSQVQEFLRLSDKFIAK